MSVTDPLEQTQAETEENKVEACNSLSNDLESISTEAFRASSRSAWKKLYGHVDARLISGFTPAYYAAVMGTGISANILYNFPFPARWLEICGIIMACISFALFLILTVLFVAALFRSKTLFFRIHCDVTMAPFMGCFVMGYTSLVSFVNAAVGKKWVIGIWVLWWVATAASFYTSFVTFFLSTIGKHRKNTNKLDTTNLSMLFLLPVVTLTVSSSVGGLITPHLASTQLKIVTMIVSFIMWAIAVVLAFIVVSVNFWRLFIHKIPNSAQVLTMFLPIGFLGQGALAILLFGSNCSLLLMQNKDTVAASKYLSFFGSTADANSVDLSNLFLMLATSILTCTTLNALSLISFGYFFTFVALTSTLSKMAPFAKKTNPALIYAAKGPSTIMKIFSGFLRFHRGFWSMTFPLGTMALANTQLYSLYNGLEAFRYIGAMYAGLLFVITISCLYGVVYRTMAICVDVLTTKPENSHA